MMDWTAAGVILTGVIAQGGVLWFGISQTIDRKLSDTVRQLNVDGKIAGMLLELDSRFVNERACDERRSACDQTRKALRDSNERRVARLERLQDNAAAEGRRE
jgi:hypothetical protein